VTKMGNYLYNLRYLDKELAKNIFQNKKYYDDEYIEYLFYFNYKYFKSLIYKFMKNQNEERKETNKLRGVLLDIMKVGEKTNVLKFEMGLLKNKNINYLKQIIAIVNTTFAILENNLFDAQADEIVNKLIKSSNAKGNLFQASKSVSGKEDMK
jgi:hypothetical protein